MRRKSPGNCSHSLWLQICSKMLQTTVSVQIHHCKFTCLFCKRLFSYSRYVKETCLHDFTLYCLTFGNLLTAMGPPKYDCVDFTKQLAGV